MRRGGEQQRLYVKVTMMLINIKQELAAVAETHQGTTDTRYNSLVLRFEVLFSFFLSFTFSFDLSSFRIQRMYFSVLFVGILSLGLANGRAIASQNCSMVVKANPNPNLYCGLYGDLSGQISSLGSATVAGDLSACASTCNSTPGCISFGFAQAASSCQLYSRSLKSMNLNATTTAGSNIYYNRGCWRQSCTSVSLPCVCTQTVTSEYPVALI